ncbi:hypothetical protein ASU31_13325 [Pedobacter ginsenosidimutans]|uniref:Uncharacterized protein n=1 Tax=Pedobacter ginsenosidimutans TaxID=687842 RepID=A0A0T5VP99_9SPHI|nr:hypothetical protein ASU31_13325 [Pedobacter ginsenosidimutans]
MIRFFWGLGFRENHFERLSLKKQLISFLEKQSLRFMAMLVPPHAHTPAGFKRKAGIRHVGFRKLSLLHSFV